MVAIIAAVLAIQDNMGKNQHVVKTPEGWGIYGENNTRITQEFDTQKKAIEKAREIAMNQKSEVFIHRKNGEIRDRNSYGNDPSSSKG